MSILRVIYTLESEGEVMHINDGALFTIEFTL